jgi:hypothetical protein
VIFGAPATFVLHGYRLETDLALPGYQRDDVGSDHSSDVLRLSQGSPGLPAVTGRDDDVLADLDDPAHGQVYRFSRSADRLVLRFNGVADIVADPSLRDGVARPWPGVDPGVLSVLIPGSVMAARLILDGRLVLHASAFEVGDSALAVVGGSGMGKSTLGALAVLAGYRLVSDDVLRVGVDSGVLKVWPGGAESRLRPSARAVVPQFAATGTVRETADGRTAVAGASTGLTDSGSGSLGPLPLTCCVVPFPRRDATRVELRRLRTFDALRRLSSFPRVVGWRDPVTTAQQFHLLADLCERVPVVEATVPWGPPFDPHIVSQVVAAVETL